MTINKTELNVVGGVGVGAAVPPTSAVTQLQDLQLDGSSSASTLTSPSALHAIVSEPNQVRHHS